FLMVSSKGDELRGEIATRQPVQHTRGIRTAIDVVAEEYRDRRRRRVSEIGFDSPSERLQQVATPMDVADRINAQALGQRRGSPLFRGKHTREAQKGHGRTRRGIL